MESGGKMSAAASDAAASGQHAIESVEATITSTGHGQSSAAWLDLHFEDCRPEYEAMLRSVGLQSGWQVLDAGTGGGAFLPLMAELVGAGGSIAALDLAPENVAAVRERLAAWHLPCPVVVGQGTLLALPYPDAHFDAAWCANVSQYLTDDELATALAELRRVVRPGGLVAVKEFEGGHLMFAPADPAIPARMYEVGRRTAPVAMSGQLRARQMGGWLRRAGLVDVWQRTTLSERVAPLRPIARRHCADFFRLLGQYYLDAAANDPEVARILATDLPFLRDQLDPDSPAALVNSPDFYRCEGAVVAVGRVPGGD